MPQGVTVQSYAALEARPIRLRDLPAELRNRIYKYIVVVEENPAEVLQKRKSRSWGNVLRI